MSFSFIIYIIYGISVSTRERDELLERVTALSSINQTLSHREEELYQQVKKSIALVEQAQLEQTEVCVTKCLENIDLISCLCNKPF